MSDRRARTSSCTKSIKPPLFDFRGKAVVASNTKGNDPTNFLWRICNEKNLDGSSKYGFVDFHAPTHNNPSTPIRMPVETDEEYAARRQFELIDDLIASNHPLVYQQEHLVESIGAGSRFSISRRCFSTLGQLKIMASAVLFERHPLERTCFTLLRPDSIATTVS